VCPQVDQITAMTDEDLLDPRRSMKLTELLISSSRAASGSMRSTSREGEYLLTSQADRNPLSVSRRWSQSPLNATAVDSGASRNHTDSHQRSTKNLSDEFEFKDEPPMSGVMGALGVGLLRGVARQRAALPSVRGSVQPPPTLSPSLEQSTSSESILLELVRQQQISHKGSDWHSGVVKAIPPVVDTAAGQSVAALSTESSAAYSLMTSGDHAKSVTQGRKSATHVDIGSQSDGHTAPSTMAGQLFVQDASGKLVLISAPVHDLNLQHHFIMGSGGTLMMVPNQPTEPSNMSSSTPVSLLWQCTEICLLAIGVIMVLINAMIIVYLLLFRFLLDEV